MHKGELTSAIESYRAVIGSKPYFVRHTYNSKRIDQLRRRAIHSIGLTPQNRYHKGWSKHVR